MANRPGDASGTDGGKDVEPLRGGMKELERGEAGPRGRGPSIPTHLPIDEPLAPYHETLVPEGGAAPRGGEVPEGGSTPREGTPPEPGEVQTDQDAKIRQERHDHENEGGNTPRHDPATS